MGAADAEVASDVGPLLPDLLRWIKTTQRLSANSSASLCKCFQRWQLCQHRLGLFKHPPELRSDRLARHQVAALKSQPRQLGGATGGAEMEHE